MGREKRDLNPAEAHRRSQKRKLQEKKKNARREQLSRLPLARRDPSKLLMEIERLRALESKGGLDGPARMKRKHLEQQFVALNKARDKAGLPFMSLPDFDPETYLQCEVKGPQVTIDPSFGEPSPSNMTILQLPMPDDEPFEGGPPGLPPYLARPRPSKAPSTSFIISSEPVKDEKSFLQYQVDQFLRDL